MNKAFEKVKSTYIKVRDYQFSKKTLFAVLKQLPLFVLVAGITAGVILFVNGIYAVEFKKEELTDKPVGTLNTEIGDKSEDLEKILDEINAENEKNGMSDKYFELQAKASELSVEISKATNSMYLKQEKGEKMPETVEQKIAVAPGLVYGPIFALVGIGLAAYLRMKTKNL